VEETAGLSESVFSQFIHNCAKLTHLRIVHVESTRPPRLHPLMYSEEARSVVSNTLRSGYPLPEFSVMIARWEEELGVQDHKYDKRAHKREVFESFFGNLPEGLESLLVVADVQKGFHPLEVFGMYDLLKEGKLRWALRDLKVLLSGPAAARYERFINHELQVRDLRLTVGIWDDDAAFEPFREDSPMMKRTIRTWMTEVGVSVELGAEYQ
jgi:hypothetical protein